MSGKDCGETSESDVQLLSADYKDGELEIVEVTPYEKESMDANVGSSENGDETELKLMQVLDADKNMMVDLLNLTIVRSEDGQESFQLVSNADSTESIEATETVTCVLETSDDADDQDNQETYVMVESSQGPLMILRSALQQGNLQIKKPQPLKPPPSPAEILEKAKALQKAKAEIALRLLESSAPSRGRGRRRRHVQLPSTPDLFKSPEFKLFLYSCKLCSFKCNAIKELTAHKAAEHAGGGGSKGRSGWRAASITLQCARCPFRGCTHTQLMKHVREHHSIESNETKTIYLDNEDILKADVIVCGACGFESTSRKDFKKHIEDEHKVVAY